MHCRFVDSAWRESLWAISLSRIPLVSPAELIDTILNADMVLGLDKKYLRAFALNAAIVFDVLWHTRNLVVHEDARADIGTLVESIRRRFAEHSGTWIEVDRAVSSSWQPLLSGWLKVSTDVAIRSSESYTAISVRDSHNSLCLAYTERLVAIDLLFGETFTLVEAVRMAVSQAWSRVVFECDSLVLCKDIISQDPPSVGAILPLVEFIRSFLQWSADWRIAWVPAGVIRWLICLLSGLLVLILSVFVLYPLYPCISELVICTLSFDLFMHGFFF